MLDGTLEVYGIGALRAYVLPHPRRGHFHADTATFTRGLISPPGLERIYTGAAPRIYAASNAMHAGRATARTVKLWPNGTVFRDRAAQKR
ncbi:hypothetical protein [Streptomyces sp. NPDC002779]|uniref:hypothetical protein n=1 Tax=Streptomyces sp. NPDC002779 TaxID=3364664 RepID=UPI00369A2740